MSLEIIRKVDNVLDQADVPERHTYFQMKHFIVGKECTIQGQMWQIIRELRARRESLESLQEQIDDLDDDIKISHVQIERRRKIGLGSAGLTELDNIEIEANMNKSELRVAISLSDQG